MQRLMLLGDEAIGQGAIDGGMSGIYGYPGTPSTEIMEYVQNSKEAAEKEGMTQSAFILSAVKDKIKKVNK